jgi:hypothetical protein
MASRAAIPGIQLPKGSTRFFVENLLPENSVLFRLTFDDFPPAPLRLVTLSSFFMPRSATGGQKAIQQAPDFFPRHLYIFFLGRGW